QARLIGLAHEVDQPSGGLEGGWFVHAGRFARGAWEGNQTIRRISGGCRGERGPRTTNGGEEDEDDNYDKDRTCFRRSLPQPRRGSIMQPRVARHELPWVPPRTRRQAWKA